MQETRVQPLGQEDPWRRAWQPTPIFLPGKSHGQRRLAGYSPWGSQRFGHYWAHTCLSTPQHTHTITNDVNHSLCAYLLHIFFHETFHVFCPFSNYIICFFTVKVWEFSTYSRHCSPAGYGICKYYLSVYNFSFHPLKNFLHSPQIFFCVLFQEILLLHFTFKSVTHLS